MISKEHKNKLESLWTLSCNKRDRAGILQTWDLYKAVSSGDRDDLDFGNELLHIRDQIHQKETYKITMRLMGEGTHTCSDDVELNIVLSRESDTPFSFFKKEILRIFGQLLDTEAKAIKSLAYGLAYDALSDEEIPL